MNEKRLRGCVEYTLPIVSRLLVGVSKLGVKLGVKLGANDDRGVCMSVMCSLITDNVSLMTGESACEVPVRDGVAEGVMDVRSAFCARGEGWPPAALAGRCCVEEADKNRCWARDVAAAFSVAPGLFGVPSVARLGRLMRVPFGAGVV